MARLRVAVWYEFESANLGSYIATDATWPQRGAGAILFENLCGDGGTHAVEEFISVQAVTPFRVVENLRESGVQVPRSDPALRHPDEWDKFVTELYKRGCADFGLSALERVGADSYAW